MFPQIFGKYVLERPLAVGGMARVFLATLRGAGGFEKKLVVKQIRAEFATDDAFVRRFVDEAKTTVDLSHPNIVPVYELGVEQGIYYLAMELCDGVTLAELLEKAQKLTPAEGAYVGIEICRALDYAHRKARIIHRDVTPRNVVIDEEGAVRLIDFGIAAPAYDGANEVFGSPGHMPPEQLRGDEVGPPADVFAVAALLYEAWSGRPPFRRRTVEQSQTALSEPLAALSTFDPVFTPLDALLASALAMDPAHRPQSAEELSRPLRRFIAESDLGDLGRKVGERVRDLRATSDAGTGLDLSETPAGETPVASETRTFATRGYEPLARDVPTAPSKGPRSDVAPYIATRRMNDDAGSWSSAGGRQEARTSVRPVRARRFRSIAGLAFGLVVVAAAAGAAWHYGDSATGASTERRETVALLENAAVPAPALETLATGTRASDEKATPGSEARRDAGVNTRSAVPHAAPSPAASPGTSANGGARAAASSMGDEGARLRAANPASSETATAAGGIDAELGHLRILANPMANVEIDGRPRGAAPIADIALPPGTHFVRLDCAALGEAVAQNVPLAAGETVTISGDFTGAHGRILVRRTSVSH
ncbi:MAG TPA: protein kinase [Polyangiaceae bacterium]|nr:protein kinase [Polyangiaceae bacterium]